MDESKIIKDKVDMNHLRRLQRDINTCHPDEIFANIKSILEREGNGRLLLPASIKCIKIMKKFYDEKGFLLDYQVDTLKELYALLLEKICP